MAATNADVTKGQLALYLTEQAIRDAKDMGVLWQRLVRRGYRERADRAVRLGLAQAEAEREGREGNGAYPASRLF